MPDPAPVFLAGSFSQAVEMAIFMIIVSVILAVFWYIIIWVLGMLFKPKRQGFGNFGDEYLDKSLAVQSVPRGRELSEDGRPIGRAPTNGPW